MNSYALECDLYSAIPIEQDQNSPSVLVSLLETDGISHRSTFFFCHIEIENIRGLMSCGIPPRNTLHDNDGGRMENVRGRTGNGDVQIRPG